MTMSPTPLSMANPSFPSLTGPHEHYVTLWLGEAWISTAYARESTGTVPNRCRIHGWRRQVGFYMGYNMGLCV